VDSLQPLLKQATDLGLAGEYAVQDAALRLKHVQSLIELRDRIRMAVELCSPSKMKSSMAERARLVRLYGPDLLLEEEKAVLGLMRMLSYQHRIDSTQLNANTISLRSASIVMAHDKSMSQEQESSIGAQEGDVFLPPFVHQLLERLRLLTLSSSEEYKAAMEKWTKAVPDELRRAFYMRIYKWVVAFATWRSSDPSGGAALKTKDVPATTAGDHHAPSSSSSTVAVFSPSKHTGRSDRLSVGPQHGPNHNHRPSPSTAYATRQARSKVVAHEALKKGKQVLHVEFSPQADAKLDESLKEIAKFRKKVGQIASTFSG